MAMDPLSLKEQPRLLAVEVGEVDGLDSNVRLELDGTRTVLVGRNGAGKSLVVEAIHRGMWQARLGRLRLPRPLGSFRCEIARPDLPTLGYEYRRLESASIQNGNFTEESPDDRNVQWFERCWEIGGNDLWKIEDSKLTILNEKPSPFVPGIGLLSMSGQMSAHVPAVAQVDQILGGIYLLSSSAGSRKMRKEIFVKTSEPHTTSADPMTRWILQQWEREESSYRELVEILRMLSLVQDITVKIYKAQGSDETSSDDMATVLFDGVNVGLQSDGTLRAAEIVIQLLRKGTTCLIIEEPELAVHPGLLGKLLELITSYSMDRQIVLTTHSPQVVNWCEPSQLRLVEREGKTTRIHKFEEARLPLIERTRRTAQPSRC